MVWWNRREEGEEEKTEGQQSRRWRKKYTTFAFYARYTLLAVATRRSIDAATSDVASLPLFLFPSLSLFISPSSSHPTSRSLFVTYTRMELLRSRAVGCNRHGRGFEGGSEAPPATDQRRPCTHFLFLPRDPSTIRESAFSTLSAPGPSPFVTTMKKYGRREDMHSTISSCFIYILKTSFD